MGFPPALYVGDDNNWQKIEFWRQLVKLPLNRVCVNGNLIRGDLEEFCELARNARNLDGDKAKFEIVAGNFSPEDLSHFNGVLITELNTRALARTDSDSDFI